MTAFFTEICRDPAGCRRVLRVRLPHAHTKSVTAAQALLARLRVFRALFSAQQECELTLNDSELHFRLREIRVKDVDVLQETGRP